MKSVLKMMMFVFVVTGLYAADKNFEVGLSGGNMSFSEDNTFEDKAVYGFYAKYDLNENMSIKTSLDFYEGESSDPVISIPTGGHVLHYGSNGYLDAVYDITWNFERSVEYEMKPLFFEFDYQWNFDKFKPYVGVGIGYSFNDASAKSSYQLYVGDTAANQEATDSVSGSSLDPRGHISQKNEIDDAFIYGFSGGLNYAITDYLSFGINARYVFGEADTEYSIQSDYSNFIINSSGSSSIDIDSLKIDAGIGYRF